MKIPNLIVLEYSVSQDCFHIQSLADMIKENMMQAFVKGSGDYIPIAVFENELDANDFSEKFRAAMVKQNIKDIDSLITKALNNTDTDKDL